MTSDSAMGCRQKDATQHVTQERQNGGTSVRETPVCCMLCLLAMGTHTHTMWAPSNLCRMCSCALNFAAADHPHTSARAISSGVGDMVT